jgi:uncharacterized protein (TIGR02246 family)
LTQTDEQAIRDLVARWNEAAIAGDVEAVLTLIAEDAVFLVAGREPFGKEAFEQGLRAGLEHVRIDVRSEIEELQVVGDFACLRNHLRVTMTSRGGGAPMKRAGYTLTILRKQADGRWLLSRDANLLTADTSG